MLGKPVVAGTRITVELILEAMGAGESVEQILDAYPRLTRADILACLRFAARTVHEHFKPFRLALGRERDKTTGGTIE